MKTTQKDDINLVVGLGEVGSAVQKILSCDGHDPVKGVEAAGSHYDVLHICFPYDQSKYDFISEVKNYKKRFQPKLVVIHSTVPVGTSRSIGAVHSPIRGVHPRIDEGIKTFVKFFGGERAREAAAIFEARGVTTHVTSLADNTEAGKLWDTTQYGIMILINKEIYAYCKSNGLDFGIVYEMFNETYNKGYRKLGREEVVRPHLKYMEGPIGGHCVVQNAELLESVSAKRILRENGRLQTAPISEYSVNER